MVTGRIARIRGMDQNKFDLKTLTRHFEVHNRSEGKSARAVEWYNGALKLFQGWLEDEGIPTNLEHLGEDEVREFILYLQGRKGL